MSNPLSNTISIIIRTFNEGRHLERLLGSIARQQTSLDYEIVVVDSGSTDDSVRIAERYGARLVMILPEQFSFGFSLNRGMEQASGEFCVFISGHCYPANDRWLENLIEPFSDADVAVAYGKQRGDGTTKYSEHQIFQKWFPDDGKGRQRLVFCNNANAAIRKSLWRECKYDEVITGLEDIDWARKMVDRGKHIYYAPDAEVIHVHNESYSQIFRRYKREALALHAMYPHNRFTALDFLKLFVLNVMSDCYHALKDGCFLASFCSIIAMRFSQFWGTYKGHNHRDNISQALRYKFYYPKKPSLYSKWERIRNGTARQSNN